MPVNSTRPAGVRCTCQATSRPVAASWNTPWIASAADSRSGAATSGNSDLRAVAIRATMPRIVTPSATCTRRRRHARGRSSRRRSSSPTRAARAAARGAGRRGPLRSRLGPAASALASATSRPAPRTKSRWNGKKPLTIGTNSTPPPTPAGTATMPSAKADDEQRERPDPPDDGVGRGTGCGERRRRADREHDERQRRPCARCDRGHPARNAIGQQQMRGGSQPGFPLLQRVVGVLRNRLAPSAFTAKEMVAVNSRHGRARYNSYGG